MSITRGLLAALAIASAAVPAAAAGADLERLFFTPQQREDMNRRRISNVQEAVVVVEDILTVNGQVMRSEGPATRWINGMQQGESQPGRDPAEVTIQPAQGDPPVRVKVGQTFDRVSGEVRKVFGKGEVNVGGTPPKPR